MKNTVAFVFSFRWNTFVIFKNITVTLAGTPLLVDKMHVLMFIGKQVTVIYGICIDTMRSKIRRKIRL